MQRVAIVNGPNLHRIGRREPDLYGLGTMEEALKALHSRYPQLTLSYAQSHHEGELIEQLYNFEAEGVEGVVLNAGAYTHTSVALVDAVRAIGIPVVEVHISNIYSREPYRQHSLLAPHCVGQISGFGLDVYRLGVEALLGRVV